MAIINFNITCAFSKLLEHVHKRLTCSLPAYEYTIPGNQPKIKHISVVLPTA